MNVLSITAIPKLLSPSHQQRRVGVVLDKSQPEKVQLAPSSWIAIWGLFLTAIISGATGVWMVVGAATANTERLVKLEVSMTTLNTSVSEMSHNNALLALHANQIEELNKFKDRVERQIDDTPTPTKQGQQ